MASARIHESIAKEINKEFNMDEILLRIGTVAPDCWRNVDTNSGVKDKYLTHFWDFRIKEGQANNYEEFYLKYLEWLFSKGVNVNPIKGGRTLLDKVNKKANSKGVEVKMWKKFRDILTKFGGKIYRDFKDDFQKEHTDYEFALFLLSQ